MGKKPTKLLDKLLTWAKSVQGVVKICTALTVPMPVVANAFRAISPPWPALVVVCIISAVMQSMTFGVSWLCWGFGIRKQFKVIIAAVLLVMFLVAVVMYSHFYSEYVVSFPNEPDQPPVVIGSVFVRQEIADLVRSDPSTYTNRELLDRYEHDPERIWTLPSITRNRIWLLAGWLILWAAPMFFIALFAVPDPKSSRAERKSLT